MGKQAINKNVLPFPVIRVLPTFFIIKPTAFLIGWFCHPNAAYRNWGKLSIVDVGLATLCLDKMKLVNDMRRLLPATSHLSFWAERTEEWEAVPNRRFAN